MIWEGTKTTNLVTKVNIYNQSVVYLLKLKNIYISFKQSHKII